MLRSRLVLSAAAAVLVAGLAACSGDKPARPGASPSSTTTTVTPTPTPTGPSPLVGGPVLAVKIDNTSAARPRIGLDKADVVYVEPVEGGLTRLLAVFSRTMPAEVGPVRSGRESDVDLVANYGKVALAFSGSSSYTARILNRGAQVNLSFDQSRRGYRRDSSRPAPYNVIGDPKELLARAGGSVKPKDIGRSYRLLVSRLDLQVPMIDSNKYVVKVANGINISEKTKRKALAMVDEAQRKGVSIGKDPMGIAASVLYLAGQVTGELKTQAEIAKAAGVTEITVRNRSRELRVRLGMQ